VNGIKWAWLFPPRSGFGAKQMVFSESDHEKQLLYSTQDKIKLLKVVAIWLHVPYLPVAVTGFPTGVEFKLFNVC